MAQVIRIKKSTEIVTNIFGDGMHLARVRSFAAAVHGALGARRLCIAEIGRSLAATSDRLAKHAIKQVDRLVGNALFDMETFFSVWVAWVVAARARIVVTLDWTDYDADDQTTLALNLVTRHGRATPLAWITVRKSTLKGSRSDLETEFLLRFERFLPKGVQLVLLADRGFGDISLYELLEGLGWSYVIRFRGNIKVTSREGDTRLASEWLHRDGHARLLQRARVTESQRPVARVVCVHEPGMKDAWHLASNLEVDSAEVLMKLYGRRFTCEESFRDSKDDRFGMGFKETTVSTCERRERLLAIGAVAAVLMTLLGAAGEVLGIERWLKANTSPHRTHSLFRQGREYFRGVPRMILVLLKRRFWSLLCRVAHAHDEAWVI
jgi:hypothetical protein